MLNKGAILRKVIEEVNMVTFINCKELQWEKIVFVGLLQKKTNG